MNKAGEKGKPEDVKADTVENFQITTSSPKKLEIDNYTAGVTGDHKARMSGEKDNKQKIK